ncbi:VOC family protein [Corynebacterium poyangense]|uniref:VOC family protein n=1 Tax=Corynebacterium poyangense TaxID=2684405 RepID=A0A7H0SLA8_9CORY|nr:VOC family protein [Corynebacterium poyangense]QNQ89333.1 VOC family protein [Corynebacterium poyangense]
MPAFGALGGMPYWVELTSTCPAKSAHFYSRLLGWEFEGDDYRLARVQGLPVAGIVQQPEEAPFPDTWVTYFLADDLDAEVNHAEELGARILSPISDVRLGRMALLADPSGALLGLIEPPGEEAFVAAGEPGTPVWHELSCTTNYDAVITFYEEFFNWMTHSIDSNDDAGNSDFRYTTALMDGAPFCGVRDVQGQFPPQVPSFWQTYLGVADVQDIAKKVPELGGEVIRGPFNSEFGRMLILSDSTGATVTVCEVAPPVEEGAESDPLHGIDLSQFQY